jgi:hypothetical protein
MNSKILLAFFVLIFAKNYAQKLFKGAGAFGSLTQSAHYYTNSDTEKKVLDTNYQHPEYFYPQSHISQEYFNWGAGAFLELSRHNIYRWQTELEYINVGANELELTNPFRGDRTSSPSANKYTYIEWNNYFKIYQELGLAHWYIMPGIRLQYLFKKAPTVFTTVSGSFPSFWYSGDLGLGYEYPVYKNYSVFSEYHLITDILPYTKGNTKVRNRTLELRIGVVYRPRKRRIDDCNAPKYKGPAY